MREKNKSFISYLNDDGQQVSSFVNVLELNSNFVKFATDTNVIVIPVSRILKIKQTKEEK